MKRSKFSLSNYKLFSCDMGELVPCGITEVLPGDTMQQATAALIRMSPMLAPVMHPVNVRIHHWYVPYRLLWDEWEDFITGGPDGLNASEFPTITFADIEQGSLADYLGIPTGSGVEVSALPFRAYAHIFNEWYRDQDLQDELPWTKDSGDDTETSADLMNVSWEKDYFTSARPWEQKGPGVTIPIGDTAPVLGIGIPTGTAASLRNETVFQADGSTVDYTNAIPTTVSSNNDAPHIETSGQPDPYPQVYADLSAATGINVNELREALALQRFEEARARYGSRYTEYLRYLGVRSSDARLQRPEYLGGGRQTLQFSEVMQTAEGESPVATLRGHGIGAVQSARYRRFFEEHGVVISLMSVRPKAIYSNGLQRFWSKRTKEDFWQRELQHIGQQTVWNNEVYAAASDAKGTFGFQDRYDEYRRTESTIAGEFRDSTLNFWHLARQFDSEPALNDDFIRCQPSDRIFAVPTYDNLYVMAQHSIQARRLLSRTGKSFIY